MQDKKTIAFYIGSLARGGAEHVMVNLADYFSSQGYQVYLVTKLEDPPEYDVPEGVTRILADITENEIGASRVKNLCMRIGKLRRIWKETKPDIIVSFIRKNNLMAIASSRGLGIPVVVSIRSNPARELSGDFFKRLSFFMFRFADGIITQTSRGVEFLPKYLRKKAVIMPNSVDQRFMEKELSQERKNQIVSVGRIDDNKNQKMLLEAFNDIKNEYPSWSLHLYGDGEQRSQLEDLYDCDQVTFHGQVSDVEKHVKDASIFVLPSKQEGMPNALIEAMALGLACISTDCPCGGPADLIDNGRNGILIPVDDRKALENQLRQLMENEDTRKRLGEEATKIKEALSPDIVNLRWKKYLDKIILDR